MAVNTIESPASFTYTIGSIDKSDAGMTITFILEDEDTLAIENRTPVFVQDETSTENGIAVLPYGAIIVGKFVSATKYSPVIKLNDDVYEYTTPITLASVAVGDTVTISLKEPS